ncbi:hypothetical protein GGR58DRAFT_452051 [Xylaria digitata]|nr:hypothetical protein GGR58DRAFT_452051 [Xylaria digitata]
MEQQVQDSPSSETTIAGPSTGENGGIPRRKAPHEYSTNPNTIRVRQRNARLTPYQREVERAKSNDLKAVSCAWKERVKTETYEAAPEHRKKKILEEVEQEVMDRRRRKGIDANSKIAALNQKYMPDETVPAPNSGLVAANNRANPVPKMARPGYVPFPARMIPELMNAPPSQSNPFTPASTLAPVSTPASTSTATQTEDETVQSTSSTPTGPMTSDSSTEISVIIETLQAQYEAEKRRREEDYRRHEVEIRELWAVVAKIQAQMPQMAASLDRAHAAYNYPPLTPLQPAPPLMPVFSPVNRFMPMRAPQPVQQYSYCRSTNVDDDGYAADDSERRMGKE